MEATFFEKQADFKKWLIKNHKNEKELLVGFYKVNSGKPSMTWTESVDEALCFGSVSYTHLDVYKRQAIMNKGSELYKFHAGTEVPYP